MRSLKYLLTLGILAILPAQSQGALIELITNGDFETGTFAGWTTADLPGGSGSWFIDAPGTSTPFSGQPTAANAGGGLFYAVTDQGGPGTHVLLQSFVVPFGVTALTLTFDMFANDWDGGPFVHPAGLDHNFGPNQHARVDILTSGAAAFSTALADVVSNHYLGVDGGADPNPYTSYSINLTGLAAGSYQLRFGEVDNQLFFNVGVDNVSILADVGGAVPEPASMTLLAIGGLGLALRARRRRVAKV